MATDISFQQWSSERRIRVEDALTRWIPEQMPGNMAAPMRYAVLGGGKRLRPLLVFAASEAVGGNAAAALRAACAIELIHAYSLVHDDMPCMDDDVLRRGKPTVHVQFDEATALLTGDALQTLAFELLTPPPSGDGGNDASGGNGGGDTDGIPCAMQARLCRILARAAGGYGMVAGQAIDLAHVGKAMTLEQLQQMHELKTGALLLAAAELGAATAGGAAENTAAGAMPALEQYARAVGLAFQVVDDILDVTADSATLGKTAGKDALADKPTYVSLLGLEAARDKAQELHTSAQQALERLQQQGVQTRWLAAIAELVIERSS